MSFEPREYLRHIHAEADYLATASVGLTREKYRDEWRAMAGMRDRLIHDYFGIDHDLVWDVLQNKIPTLRAQMERILAGE